MPAGPRSRLLAAAACAPALLLSACAPQSGHDLPAASSLARATAQRAESALPSQSFVDSVGVNVHLGYGNTPYGQEPQRIVKLVKKLGVHHLRDGTYVGQSAICALDQNFAAQGVFLDFIVSPGETDTQLQQWQACSAPAADAYEGYNEYDLSGDPNWVADLQAAQAQIYAWGHAAGFTVAGPSLTSQADYAALGPVSADAGNMHDYFGGHNPGTPGWGDTGPFGTYGSLAYNIAVAQETTGQAPMWSTETGYGDQPGTPAYVPPATKMHYTLRTLLLQWNAGVARTYIYELVDEGGGDFGSYGLADAKIQPKPAFIALSAMLAHLASKTSAAASLDYTLQAGAGIDHTLLAKAPNHFVLAVWQEVPEWDPNTGQPIAVYPQPVNLTFPAAPRKLTVTTFADSGRPGALQMPAQNTLNLSVDGGVTLVDIYL